MNEDEEIDLKHRLSRQVYFKTLQSGYFKIFMGIESYDKERGLEKVFYPCAKYVKRCRCKAFSAHLSAFLKFLIQRIDKNGKEIFCSSNGFGG